MAKPISEMTPMQRQYHDIKERNQDCILFFRLGDFYEMFDEDAKTAARELDLTLTTRDRGKPKEEQTPMCGVPYHSVDSYIARLVQKGYKVAICEQMEDPATAKGIVERDITRIVTPGTVTESQTVLCALVTDGCNEVVPAFFQHATFGDGAGGDDTGDLPFYNALSLGRIFNLLTDSDFVALGNQTGNISIYRMEGDTAHRCLFFLRLISVAGG